MLMNLDALRLYYDHPEVKETFQQIAPKERYKMQSNLYRYNGKVLQIIADNIYPQNGDDRGYRPKYGYMNYEPKADGGYSKPLYDKRKILYLGELIRQCKRNNIQIVFCISPFYGGIKHVEICIPRYSTFVNCIIFHFGILAQINSSRLINIIL